MAVQTRNRVNPIVQKIADDGVFGAGMPQQNLSTESKLNMARESTFANLRGYGSSGAGPQNVMQAGMGQPAPVDSGLSSIPQNVFGAGMPKSQMASLPIQTQIAGYLADLDETKATAMYQQALRDAGVNLNPDGQAPGDFSANVAAARGIYNRVFGGGATGSGVQAFAPTGLRQQAIAAGGAPVTGFGGVQVTASPNAQGGTGFTLTQGQRPNLPAMAQSQIDPNPTPAAMEFLSTGVAPQNPGPFPRLGQAAVGGQTAAQATPSMSQTVQAPARTPYEQQAANYKNHLVTQQMQAGLLKSLPPGYMLDPIRPNAIMPIPGGPAEMKMAEDRKAVEESNRAIQEAARQSLEKASIVTKTINKILPQLGPMTTGPVAALTEAVPGTPAYNVGKLKDTVVANIGLKELKAMKEASKTGASGMGALSEKELAVLETSLGNLKLAQNTKQVAQAMRDVRNSFYRWRATYNAGQLGDTPVAQQRQTAVKWALANPKDPRSEQILSMDDN